VDAERHCLQEFQLLVELFVAEEEPLRELYDCIEAVDEVIHVVDDFLVFFYLCLFLDYSAGDNGFHPCGYALELE
jgi:hypothetical protein